MTTIQYREIVYDGFHDAEIVDENLNLDLKHFAEACGQSPDWILQLLEYEILPARPEDRIHQFLEKISHAHVVPIVYNVTLKPVYLPLQ